MMKQKLFALLATMVLLFGMNSCKDDPESPSQEEMEKSLVGLWYEEFEESGEVEESGEEFSSVVLAMQVNEDHTGCLYLGAFNEGDHDNPIVVYGAKAGKQVPCTSTFAYSYQAIIKQK